VDLTVIASSHSEPLFIPEVSRIRKSVTLRPHTGYQLFPGFPYISAAAPEVDGVATEPEAQPERYPIGPPLHFESSGLPIDPQVGLLLALRTRSQRGRLRIRWDVVLGLISAGAAALHQDRVARRAVRLVRDSAAAIDCWWSR